MRFMKSIEGMVAGLGDTVSSCNVINAKLPVVIQGHDRLRLVYQAKMFEN
jgi:hypothetical protein